MFICFMYICILYYFDFRPGLNKNEKQKNIKLSDQFQNKIGDSSGCDRIVVGFTTTYAISAYHH